MCGIAGFLGRQGAEEDAWRMASALTHRGPDDAGVWVDADNGVALAHRRLSILDLSPEGHQPMVSPSGRYVLVFNGEIYNHLDLRCEMESAGQVAWRGHSDTETLLAGVEAWGVRKTVEKSVGMFAMAVWDREERTLTLIRDRMGEKPLYYGWQNGVFLFGSELKSLRAHPAFNAEVDRDALCLFVRHAYVPMPHSIYKGIRKLTPGCLLTISRDTPDAEEKVYWSLFDTATAGVHHPFSGSAAEAVDELEQVLKDAVRKQMISDVPLGAFLSGGVDSSTVVALMQAQSARPVKTFTIGFQEEGFNEAVYAKAVATHLGTEHTELYVSPEQAMEVIPRLPKLYDEPFADSSQIPTFLVSQLARQHVTVSLSGDAGDELFCGYNRYQITASWWRKMSLLPAPLRRILAACIVRVPPDRWSRMLAPFFGSVPGVNVGDKLHKGAGVLASRSADEIFQGLISFWDHPEKVVLGGEEPLTVMRGGAPELGKLDCIERMMALDAVSYLPDDILVKVDRAAMGVSLESRVPFLDHRVVELAWRLPRSVKLRDGQSKWALRQVLYRHVPRELIERPKTGFGIPVGEWLRGPLRDWAEDLLSEQRLRGDGFFDPVPIRKKWTEHLSGTRNWAYALWNILMFHAWRNK